MRIAEDLVDRNHSAAFLVPQIAHTLDRHRSALEFAQAVMEHAQELGYVGEGSTAGMFRDAIENVEKALGGKKPRAAPVIPYAIAYECLKLLAPLDVEGEPNTLEALVRKAMEENAKLKGELGRFQRDAGRLVKLLEAAQADLAQLKATRK